jgi:poly-beta-1,6-N-acetyl-D-glucosamine biosynthesis protein PgaD
MSREWPPLITDAARPRWLLWRDRGLTLLVWGVFLALFVEQSWVLQARVETYLATPDAEWEFLLRPFVIVVGVMVAWLVLSAVLTYRRAVQARRTAQPHPLSLAAEAKHFGTTPEALTAARLHRIIAVTIAPDGRFGFDPADPICTAPAGGKDPPAPPVPDRSAPGR